MYHEKLKRFDAVSKSNCAVLTSAYDEDWSSPFYLVDRACSREWHSSLKIFIKVYKKFFNTISVPSLKITIIHVNIVWYDIALFGREVGWKNNFDVLTLFCVFLFFKEGQLVFSIIFYRTQVFYLVHIIFLWYRNIYSWRFLSSLSRLNGKALWTSVEISRIKTLEYNPSNSYKGFENFLFTDIVQPLSVDS